MPPRRHEPQHERLLRDLEAIPSLLNDLLQSHAASHLLQQPPAADPSPEQHNLMACCAAHFCRLVVGLDEKSAATATLAPGRLLGLLLRGQAARSAGAVLVWLQQRPEQLRFDLVQRSKKASTFRSSLAAGL
uniref:Uncharacterized protein n=1 Tax=Tetradesmus obliquus TaxID=3088 RepID=A0A383VK45_TETOB|eukprot:jgi/Sobl393_1/4181/SZX65571.1